MLRLLVGLAVVLSLAGSPVSAQVPAAPADSSGVAGAGAVLPPVHVLTQRVVRPDGTPVENATVLLYSTLVTDRSAHSMTTDSLGFFTSDPLPDGVYVRQVRYPGGGRSLETRVTLDGAPQPDIVIPGDPRPGPWWIILCLAVFLLTVFATRWHHIAHSLRAMLESQFVALESRLDTEVDPAKRKQVSGIEARIKEELKWLRGDEDDRFWSDTTRRWVWPWNFFWWSRGRENARWVIAHELERQLVAFLWPSERLEPYLYQVEAELRAAAGQPATAVADLIHASLAVPVATDPSERTKQETGRRALLERGLAVVNAKRDQDFASLMEWQNKASWLILVAVVMVGFLAIAVGNAVLFLAGAAGGFLSRLMRALRRSELPLDYGASWTTLFLSPMFGALAGWFGIALITVAVQPDVNLLGDAFKLVNWYTPMAPATLGIAFLLGFSERLFDAVVLAVEGHADPSAKPDATRPSRVPAALQTGSAAPAAASGAHAASSTDPPKTADGITITLPHEPITPVQAVSGSLALATAAASPTEVTLSVDSSAYEVQPASLTIATGAVLADFDVVPKGNPDPAEVRVTAHVGATVVSDKVVFT